MGIVAERDSIDITGVTADVDKIMSKIPRKIVEIKVKISFKSNLTDDQKDKLERAARTCPVSGSLHEDLKETIEFSYA